MILHAHPPFRFFPTTRSLVLRCADKNPSRSNLFQGLSSEGREDEAGLVDLGVVVLAQLDLLLRGPLAQRNFDVGLGVLGANHEADLARRVGGDGGVGILGHGEDLTTLLLELGDKREVEPLVLSCIFFAGSS